jgi:hypothetical protein
MAQEKTLAEPQDLAWLGGGEPSFSTVKSRKASDKAELQSTRIARMKE